MGAKSEMLARQFEARAQEVLARLEELSESDWKTVTAAEKWTVGVTAHHVAGVLETIARVVAAVATGQAPAGFRPEIIDEMNARHAKDYVDCTRADTIELHKKGAALAAAAIRGLDDDHLGRTALLLGGAPMTAEQVILGGLFAHIDDHFGGIRNTLGGPDGAFVVSRVLDAPRDLVWRAYTEAGRLVRWWGPKGFTMQSATVDLRPGGVFHYGMRSSNGQDMWGKWTFREIVAPERIVTIASFTDVRGTVVRHPMSPTWPLEVLSTMTLAEDAGRTTVTIASLPLAASESERRTFDAGRDGMRQGFAGTLDRLAEYLVTAKEESSCS